MKRAPLLLLAVTLFCAPALGADPKPTRLPIREQDLDKLLRTDFYGVYLLGKKIGWAKVSLSRSDDPKAPAYVSRTEFSAKFVAAGTKTEFQGVETTEFDAKAPHALRAARSRESDGRSVKEITLTRGDKGFDVLIEAAGEKVKKQIPILDYTLADALVSHLWLRQGPKVGDTITSRTLDIDDLRLDDEIRKLTATRATTADGVKVIYHEMEVTVPRKNLSGLERFDEKGEQMLSMKIAGLFEMRLEAEAVAKNTEFSGDLFEMGKVKIDKKLGDEARLTSLVLETVGKGEFNLKPGPGQAVTKNPGGTWTIKLGKEHGTPVKATDEEIKENLAENANYPLSHPRVGELAKEAVGDAKTDEEKVKRLVRFVHKYIRPSYTAQPLTVLDLIKSRKGDCTEYALLFTTLARAAGLSAREVGGLVYMGDDEKAFGHHAWNEVVLDGRWVPVDASAGLLEIGPTHLCFGSKLGDGLTNMLATFGKLTFKVVEVKHKP